MNGLRSPHAAGATGPECEVSRAAHRNPARREACQPKCDARRLESISVVHVAGPYPMTVECHRGRRYFFQLADGSSPPKPALRYDRVRPFSGARPPSSADPLVSYATSGSPRSQGAARPSFSGAELL